jgi:endonuclease/exonuclease/phosphatase family metal-dependent hydrolase
LYRRTAFVLSFLVCLFSLARPVAARPLVWVDSPTANVAVETSFYFVGWAVDLESSVGSGVGQLHAWAYPEDGGVPRWVGAMVSGPRPDVAAVFGPRYMQSGFWIYGTLPPGRYQVALTPWSTLTGDFRHDATIVVPLTVRDPLAPAPVSSKTLRVLQWNIHHGGFGTDGVYDPNRVATWAASMNPDVVMFNEIEKYTSWGNQNQPEVYKNLLQQKTGKTWYYVFAQEYGDWSSNGKGNLILSRYPINVVDRYELVQNADRSIAMATVTVNSRDITLIGTHLDPYDATLRLAQAQEVTGWSAAQPENRIVAGDMNAWPNQTSIAHFNTVYHDSWAVAAANGTATAFSGNNGETKNGRIDYIFYSKGAADLSVTSSQVIDTRDANGVMPSDHRPVLTTFAVR